MNGITKVDSFDGCLGDYIKPTTLDKVKETFACTDWDMEKSYDGKKMQPVYSLSRDNGKTTMLFSCNITNTTFLVNNGIKKPSMLVGKKITITKIKGQNAKGEVVDTLRISEVK